MPKSPKNDSDSPAVDPTFRSTLDCLPHIAWAAGLDGIPAYFNSKWYEYTGFARDIAYDPAKTIHPDDYAATMAIRNQAYSRGEIYDTHVRLRRFDGQYRLHHTVAKPLRNAEGRVYGYIGTSSDVQAEHELALLNKELDRRVLDRTSELERINAEMEAFTYHVAHDLRAPLRAIIGTSRILFEDYGANLPAAAVNLIERQVGAASRLGKLVDELLKLTRLAQQQISRQPVDVTSLAQEVAIEQAHENEKVAFRIQEGMDAQADPRLLRLLFSNLISNALRYSPEGGEVNVGLEQTEKGDAFYVRDQGIGFDMQYADKLFQPFERLVSDVDFPGTGVGLANVARIVSKHRGEVWACGELGNGATFYFTLG